ncbi:LysM peptidoglycan-binding domain-containing protein [Methylacidimicrobium tartarophylax]|uniref:LysM peptidoglycan-binding domain-containing protein n=1 Tax=Methylacidimicrobium tartarophylax TaxID=1041768 RepID=UPI0015B3971E|nr:LysM peptidoglycan-binding domain-containing protein [Methylacidimicrobium tartarophylax]
MRTKLFRLFSCTGWIALFFCGTPPPANAAESSASPPSAEAPAEPPPPGSTKYTVKQGDSLWKISRKFKISVEALRKANGLKNDRLQIGQELIVPPPAAKGKKEEADLPGGTPPPPSTPNPPAGKQP